MKKSYLLLAVLAFNGVVHAEENPYMPEAKLKGAKDVATWNIGAGFTKKLLHANLEWVNPYGIAYAKVGAFLNDDNEVHRLCAQNSLLVLHGLGFPRLLQENHCHFLGGNVFFL